MLTIVGAYLGEMLFVYALYKLAASRPVPAKAGR